MNLPSKFWFAVCKGWALGFLCGAIVLMMVPLPEEPDVRLLRLIALVGSATSAYILGRMVTNAKE